MTTKTILLALLLLSIYLQAKPFAEFESPMINESSGIVRGQIVDDFFWTHNDSGDKARVFAVTPSGELIQPDWFKGDYKGLHIKGAYNIDWEDIAIDWAGNLVIGAFGNNGSSRRDLCLYRLPEPNPHAVIATRVAEQIRFRYPDQENYPAKEPNFDAEALFCYGENYYILSKNRGDQRTKLYAFPPIQPDIEHVLDLKEEFDIDGLVTGADFSTEHSLLAVLTYNSLWLFEKEGESFLGGKHYRKALKNAKQCEAVCFNGDEVIITNEQGELFSFTIAALREYGVE